MGDEFTDEQTVPKAVKRGRDMVETFTGRHYGASHPEPLKVEGDSIRMDLLSDLMHEAEDAGEDVAELIARGRQQYEAERDAPETEPAYTVIGIYHGNEGERYATTVYTRNGPEAAEQLAQQVCREDNQAEDGEDLIEVAAVLTGEIEVVA